MTLAEIDLALAALEKELEASLPNSPASSRLAIRYCNLAKERNAVLDEAARLQLADNPALRNW